MSGWKRAMWSAFHSHGIRRRWEAIAANVISVSSGFKDAYLFDQGSVCPEIMQNFLDAVQEAGLVSSLDVLDLGDLFVIHRERLKKQCHSDQHDCFRRIKFVDVSPVMDEPRLVTDESERGAITDQLRVLTDSLLSVLSAPSCSFPKGKVITPELPTDLSGCTLFGYLLGYPVIYWISDSDPHSSNCLGMVPLRRYSVDLSTRELPPQTVSSFTIPQKLKESVLKEVAQWKQRFTSTCSGEGVKVTFNEETAALSQVAL